MAEDKVLQSEEELGLKSESSSGMSESSVSEIQEKRDLDDELSSVSLDIDKCQVVFKKESDVAGFKSTDTVTKEANVEAVDGKQDHPDQSSSDEGKDEDLSAGKIKESEIGTSTGADKSDVTSSDNGVDSNASLSVAATSEGKDSANQEKMNLEDELLSVSQQASSTAAVGSLDFPDKGLSDESEATPVEKKVDMKDAHLVDQEKSQVLSSGKSKDLDIGSSTGTSDDKVKAIQEKLDLDDKHSSDHFTSKKESVDDGSKPKVGKEDNMAADENLAAADNSSLVITETQVEAAEGDENFPFNNSSVTKEAQVEAAEGNQDVPGNSSLGATKSEATSSDNEVGFKASLSVADTTGGKDSANQEKVDLEDELSSGQFGFKKESDDDDAKSTVGQQASSTAAVGGLDFADNGLPGEKKETSILRFLIRINDNKTTSTEILSSIN
ncbi:dentin sialophosphoprotein-like [Pocillopora verrucosa]|uniref:dentin sialophosphoprotein-like n=1 Tax=Pocillopora verrucosa TaxID=203993 RepID=UPI00333FA662